MSGRKAKPIDPTALTVEEAAQLLAAGGRKVTPEMVRAAVEAGAPTSADGKINLVELLAWLEKDMAR